MRFPLKRLIAAALPVSFLWLFAACALFCGREVVGTRGRPVVSSLVESVAVKGTPACEECPVTALPMATATERETLKSKQQTPPATLSSIPPVTYLTGAGPSVRPDRRPSAPDPPLARLPALRI